MLVGMGDFSLALQRWVRQAMSQGDSALWQWLACGGSSQTSRTRQTNDVLKGQDMEEQDGYRRELQKVRGDPHVSQQMIVGAEVPRSSCSSFDSRAPSG